MTTEFEEAKDDFIQEHPELAADEHQMAAYMTIVLLFGAAAEGCNRKQKKDLYDARLMLQAGAPLRDVGAAIMDSRGPEWEIPDETMKAITALHEETT